MKAVYYTVAALTILLANNPSFGDNPSAAVNSNYEAKDNGGSVTKEKKVSVDAAGTTTTEESTKKVDVDSNGNKTTKVDIKNTTDPKGLFNKQTTEVKNKAVEKDGKSEYTHEKTVNGTTVEQTKDVEQPVK
jgi:hypothetical protein